MVRILDTCRIIRQELRMVATVLYKLAEHTHELYASDALDGPS